MILQSLFFTVAMVGDIMMGTTLPSNYLPADDGRRLFEAVAPTLQTVNFAAGSLEGTFFDGKGTPRPCTNPNTYFLFKMPQRLAPRLVEAGFDYINIATNHVNDVGPEAQDSTMAVLKRCGLAFTGLKNRCETAVVERSGKRIGICSFCDSKNSVDINDAKYAAELVRKLRPQCDLVFVAFHGGAEGVAYQHVPRKTEIYLGEKRGDVYALAHACIDAGADLVFGHGPHVPRALELYKGHLIAYSLGNFCTPFRIKVSGLCGYAPILVAELDEKGRLAGGRIESYLQRSGFGPIADPQGACARIIGQLSAQDFPSSPLRVASDGSLIISR